MQHKPFLFWHASTEIIDELEAKDVIDQFGGRVEGLEFVLEVLQIDDIISFPLSCLALLHGLPTCRFSLGENFEVDADALHSFFVLDQRQQVQLVCDVSAQLVC